MQHPILRPFAVAVATVATAATFAAAFAVHAADKPKEASFGTSKGGAFLTKAQLRECIGQQTRVKQSQADLTSAQDKLNADKADIGARGDALKTELETLDRTNAEAVAAYNDKASERDKLIDAYQARVDEFNGKVDAANADRDAWSKNCQNRRYFEDDEIAIRKGK